MAGEGDANGLPNGRSAMRRTKSRRSLASRRNSGSRAAAAAVALAGAATAAAEVHDGSPGSRADSAAGAQARAACPRRSQQRPTSRAVKPRHRAPARARAAQVAATAAAVTATAAAADSSISSQQTGHQDVAKGSSKELPEPVQQKLNREEQQSDCLAQAAEAKKEEVDERKEAQDRVEPEEEEQKEEVELQRTRRSVGVLTDADCLGPCEPGTHVNLDGIVWQETANGVLVINVTWRGKTYMGTLLDATKHDWAPPRLQCESPSSDAETRTAKSRIKRRPTLSATFQDINERKLRRQCRSSGSQSESQAVATAAADRSTPACAKRKAKPAAAAGEGAAAAASDDGAGQQAGERCHSSVSKRRRSGSYGCNGGGDPADVSYLLCPEPGCTRKYRQTSSLRHHLRQAHPSARVGGNGAAACNGSSGSSNGGSSDAASAGGSPPAEDALGTARAMQQQQTTNCPSARSSMRLSKRERRSRSSSTSPDVALATFSYKRAADEAASKHAAAVVDLAVAAAAAAPPMMDLAEGRLHCSRSSRQSHGLATVDLDAEGKDIHDDSGTGAIAADPPLSPANPSQASAPSDKASTPAVPSVSPTSNGERRVAASMADSRQTSALQPSPGVVLATEPQRPLLTAGPQLDGETMLMATSAARPPANSAAVSTLADGSQSSRKQARGGAEEAARKGAAQQLGVAKIEASVRAERRPEPEARHCRTWLRAPQQQQQPASRRTGAAATVDGELLLAGEAYSDVSDEGLLADSDSRPSDLRADAAAAVTLARVKEEQQSRGQRSVGCAQFAYPVVAVSPRKADRSEIMHAPSSMSSNYSVVTAAAPAAPAAEMTGRPFLGRPASSGLAKRPRSGEGAEAAQAITSRAGSRGGTGSSNSGHGGGGPFADVERLAALESYYRQQQQQQQQQFSLPYYHWPGFAPMSPYDDAAAASSFLQLMDWRAKALERQGIESLFSRAATPGGGSGGGAGLPDGAGGFSQRPGWESMPPNVAVPMDMHASRYEVLRESIELKSQMARLPSPRGSSRGGGSSSSGGISGGSQYQQSKQGFAAKPMGSSPCDSESSMASSASSSSAASHRRQHQQHQQRTRPAAPASPTRDCRGPLPTAAGTCDLPAHSPQRSSASGVIALGGGAASSLPADCAAPSLRLAQALDSRPLQQWSRPLDTDAAAGTHPGGSWPMDRACLAPAFSAKLSPPPRDGSMLTSATIMAASAAAGTATVPKGLPGAPGDAAADVPVTSEDKRMVGFAGSASAALLYPHCTQAAMEAADSRTLDSAASRLHQHKIHELGDVAL